jgi:hypothetical protein
MGQASFVVLQLSLASVIPPVLHTRCNPHATLNRMTSGRCVCVCEPAKKAMLLVGKNRVSVRSVKLGVNRNLFTFSTCISVCCVFL